MATMVCLKFLFESCLPYHYCKPIYLISSATLFLEGSIGSIELPTHVSFGLGSKLHSLLSMNKPDSISEIELLSRNFLSQDSNLDEYEDVDTTILSPRRVPVGRTALHCVTNVDTEFDDDQTNSSGFSSSIPKTVQDIDGVLNEIRLRSSPDPNDFIFRSGNRQYYNGDYYDDDTMTEMSYQTNSNLHMELNKAHERFMESYSDTSVLNLLGNDKASENNGSGSDSGDNPNHDSSIDLSWLRSKAVAANSSYDSRRIKYENNHIDAYENNRVPSPDKIQSKTDAYNRGTVNPGFGSENHGNYPLEIRQNSDSSDAWHQLSDSEEDVEDALSRVNRSYRRRQRKKAKDDTSYSSSSRKPTMYWVATVCSTMAIISVVVGTMLMSKYYSNYKKLQGSRFSSVDTPLLMDSNNTTVMNKNSQVESSTVFVDGSLDFMGNSPSKPPAASTITSTLTSIPADVPIEVPTIAPSAWDDDASTLSHETQTTNMEYVASNMKPVESQVNKFPASGGNFQETSNNISKEDSTQFTQQTPSFASLPIASSNSDNPNLNEESGKESISYVATNQKEVSTTVSTTHEPTGKPTWKSTVKPTRKPTRKPTLKPTLKPTGKPTAKPTRKPTLKPTGKPTAKPTRQPTWKPTITPTLAPTESSIETPTKKMKKKSKHRKLYRRQLKAYSKRRKNSGEK